MNAQHSVARGLIADLAEFVVLHFVRPPFVHKMAKGVQNNFPRVHLSRQTKQRFPNLNGVFSFFSGTERDCFKYADVFCVAYGIKDEL